MVPSLWEEPVEQPLVTLKSQGVLEFLGKINLLLESLWEESRFSLITFSSTALYGYNLDNVFEVEMFRAVDSSLKIKKRETRDKVLKTHMLERARCSLCTGRSINGLPANSPTAGLLIWLTTWGNSSL